MAQNMWILLSIVAWTLPWKGYALWLSARNSHKWWFILLLTINTLAILEIIYIFIIAKENTILGDKIRKIFKK